MSYTVEDHHRAICEALRSSEYFSDATTALEEQLCNAVLSSPVQPNELNQLRKHMVQVARACLSLEQLLFMHERELRKRLDG